MRVYTYTEARQRLAELLERAKREVEGMDLGVTVEEIVELVREGRRRYGGKTI